jgi:hypothetical protein
MMRRALAALAGLLAFGAAPAPEPVALAALLADAPAPSLDAYRLFTDAGGRQPNAGLTPYSLNTPLFSDYAEKTRYLYLPPGLKARYRAEGALDLPVGAVLVKTFAYPADFRRPNENVRFLETRPADPPQGGLDGAGLCLERRADPRRAEARRGAARRQFHRRRRQGRPRRLRRCPTPTSARNATRYPRRSHRSG